MPKRSMILAATMVAALAAGPVIQAQAAESNSAASALTTAKAGLDAYIARDIKVLDDTRSVSHDPELPLDQRVAYGNSIAAVIKPRTNTFSRKNIFAQTTGAGVARLARGWQRYHVEIVDLREAVGATADAGGGVIPPAEVAEIETVFKNALLMLEKKGTDESAALAALARIPADVAAVEVVIYPLYEVLSHADFRSHPVVTADLRACAAANKGPASIALISDLKILITALGISDSKLSVLAGNNRLFSSALHRH